MGLADLYDVMDAATVIESPVGAYVLVSQELFQRMQLSYQREQRFQREWRDS